MPDAPEVHVVDDEDGNVVECETHPYDGGLSEAGTEADSAAGSGVPDTGSSTPDPASASDPKEVAGEG